MTSTILNLFFNKFLANFIEIDTSKTNVSLFSGEIKLENLKIKSEIFQTLNIPYIELIHGYIGSMYIDLKMPFFYNYPIRVFLKKIFVHVKQKDINKLKKAEELNNIIEYNKNLLINTEQLLAQIEEVKRDNNESTKSKGNNENELVKQIINNLLIDVDGIVVRFDDDLSYKGVPYSIGVILKHIIIRSTQSDFKVPKNIDEVIPFGEINFKVANVEQLFIYMDCFNNEEDLDFNRFISPKVNNHISDELKYYLKEELNFYTYCMSELYVNYKEFDCHQYLLYQLNISMKISMNNNTFNKEPQYGMNIDFPQILLNTSLKQIRTIFKLLAYINLCSLYQNGISKEYYKNKLSKEEKAAYVDDYAKYFTNRYIQKNNIDFPSSLKSMEERVDIEVIKKLRSYALKKVNLASKLEDINYKIKEEEQKFIHLDKNINERLKEQKNKLLKIQENFDSFIFKENDFNMVEALQLDDLDDSSIIFYFDIEILMTSLTVYEFVKKKENGNWEFMSKLVSISVQSLNMEGKIQKVGIYFLFTLENIIVTQEKIKNPNYNKIIFGDLTSNEKILTIYFEINPKLKKSDYYCKITSGRPMYIILNMYITQYIQTQIVNVVSTTIESNEYSQYAKDSVLDYIKKSEANKTSSQNFSHVNIALDITLQCPVIILPIDVFKLNKNKCILLSLGELKLKSILPPRVEFNPQVDYKKTKDEYLMYDIYRISLLGTRISTMDNCVEKYNFKGKENVILNDVDFNMDCKILIQQENPNFDNIIVDLTISKIDFKISEFQILLIIEFLGNYFKEVYKLEIDMAEIQKEEEIEKLIREEELKMKDKIQGDIIKKEIEEEEKKKKEEIVHNELKKKAGLFYTNFIKSFSSSNIHRISKGINRIHSNKKNIVVNIVLKQVQFLVQKNYPDNTVEDYLLFKMDFLQVECDIAPDESLIVLVMVKNIALYDYDKNEKKERIIDPQYQCLIESAQIDEFGRLIKKEKQENDTMSFIDYQLLMIGNELNNIVHINDLHVIISLETLVHMYQFSMYYVNLYLDAINDAETWKKKEMEKKLHLNKKGFDKNELYEENLIRFHENYIVSKYDTENIQNLFKEQKIKSNIYKNFDKFKEFLFDKFSEKLAYERQRTLMTVKVNIKNTVIRLPVDPLNLKAPLFSMNFNLLYNQNTTSISTNFFTLPSKKVLATFYEYNSSSMNTYVSNFDMDMIYFIKQDQRYTRSIPEERLITNFRVKCLIDNFLVLNSGQNVMIIDVIIEPLIFAFGMRQVRRAFKFQEKVIEYLSLMTASYVPYAKPGNTTSKGRHRLSLIDMVKIVNKERKIKKNQENNVKDKKKNVNIIVNNEHFNSLLITNVKSDKVGIIFFDNTKIGAKSVLLDIKVKKLMCRFSQNSKVTDKENVSNAIYEMITNDEMPRAKFNRNTLGMYYYVFCSVQVNYYNLKTNNFDPLIEPFEAIVEMMQVAPFFRAKTVIIINDIINVNFSSDSIIAFNSFLLRYSQDEKMWDAPQELTNIIKWRSTVIYSKLDLENKARNYDTTLQFMNHSGINVTIFFESNPKRGTIIKNNEILGYTSDTLYAARGLNKKNYRTERTNFGVIVLDSYPIKEINFKRPNFTQYKINILNNNKYIPIYLNIKVESSYLLNKVSFSSSVAFLNDTKFDIIYILIDNHHITDHIIEIAKESKVYIPITWLISEPPNSSIYIKFKINGLSFKICDHITELFNEPLIEQQKEQEDLEKDILNKYKSIDNPKLKKISEIENIEIQNMKKSKKIEIIYDEKNYLINFDYFLIQSKNSKKIIESINRRKEELKNLEYPKLENEINNDISIDNLNTFQKGNNIHDVNLMPELNYEYLIVIRPSLIVVNKLPFPLSFYYNEKNLSLDSLEEQELYDYFPDKNNEIYIKIQYFEGLYSSQKINLMEIDTHLYIDLISENGTECLKCHLIKRPQEKPIQKPRSYFVDTKGHSISTYELIFSFDYLINNRLTHSLWIYPCKTNKEKVDKSQINSKSKQLYSSSLNMISFPDLESCLSIKDENSEWCQPFNINTVGVESSVKLKNEFNANESKELMNEIAYIITSSDLYDFSIIIIFEPKYIFINNLGFDIVYHQENYLSRKEYLLKKGEWTNIKFEDRDKKFRIGIYDQINHITNYSGWFNLDKNEDLDLKVIINPSSYNFPKDCKIFSYDRHIHYILIRIINHSYDNGTTYILFCHPLFPYLEIINELKIPIIITEKSSNHSFKIDNPEVTHFPFTWENPSKYEDELYFEVYNTKEKFSFSVFNKGHFRVKELNLSIVYSVNSRNNTETRSFKINKNKTIIKSEFENLEKAKRLASSSYIGFIKGVGISLINQELKEVFYISLYNIQAKYVNNNYKTKSETLKTAVEYELLVDNFQVDYCLNDSLKTIISPRFQTIPSNEENVKKYLDKNNLEFYPFIEAKFSMKTTTNLSTKEEFTSYENIELILQKMEAKIEQNEINNLLSMYNDFMKKFDYYTVENKITGQEKDKEPLLDIECPIPIKKLMKEKENSIRHLINNLALSSLQIDITLRLDPKSFNLKIPGELQSIFGGLMTLGRISNCPLKFNYQIIKNVYISWNDLAWKIITPYIKEGIIQIYKILGSLDIIGNPVNLINDITSGVYEFVTLPGKGIKNKNFGKNIVKGFGGLVVGVMGGAFNSLQKISTTLLVSLQTVLDRNKKDILYEEQNEPDNVFIGIYEGIRGFGAEIGNGFKNLCTEPCKRGEQNGVSGFFRGLCKGLIGLILSPISGILKFVSSLSGGIKNSCFSIVGRKKLKTERFRYPRIIVEGEEKVDSYNESKAEAKEILYNLNKEDTNNILYAEDFICGNLGYGRKFSTLILTDKALYVIYNTNKVIYEKNFAEIDSAEIHYVDDNLVFGLRLKSGNLSGFKVHKDYSRIPIELYDLINIKLTRIKNLSYFGTKISGLHRGIDVGSENSDGDIDASSYTKTLSYNTYNSLNTMESKIDK